MQRPSSSNASAPRRPGRRRETGASERIDARPRSGQFRQPAARDIRVGPIRAIPALLAERGLDPARALAGTALPLELFGDPENRVSIVEVGRVLAHCAALTDTAHFGLAVGERFTLDDLGILGTLMRNSPTVRDALRLAFRHSDLQDRGATALLVDSGAAEVAMGYSLFDSEMAGVEHVLDGTVAIYCRMMRELCGPSWRPRAVHLSHRRPAKVGPLKRFFGPNVDFDASLSAVVFDARWLEQRIAGADPALFAAAVERIRSLVERTRTPFADEARRAIHALIFTGSASAASLAAFFGLHERTLRRQLAAEGATVRELVNQARHEVARHLLRDTTLPVSQVAGTLRYSSVTAFCRAFRALANRSPQQWRLEAARRR